MAIILNGHITTELKLKASDGSEVIKQLSEEGTIPVPTETLDILSNGLVDVEHYKNARVQVPTGGGLPALDNPASAADILKDKESIDGSGAKLVGTCTFDADTSDADATAADIAEGKTAYVNGVKLIGTASGGGITPVTHALSACTNAAQVLAQIQQHLPAQFNFVLVVSSTFGATTEESHFGYAVLSSIADGCWVRWRGSAYCVPANGASTSIAWSSTNDLKISEGEECDFYMM